MDATGGRYRRRDRRPGRFEGNGEQSKPRQEQSRSRRRRRRREHRTRGAGRAAAERPARPAPRVFSLSPEFSSQGPGAWTTPPASARKRVRSTATCNAPCRRPLLRSDHSSHGSGTLLIRRLVPRVRRFFLASLALLAFLAIFLRRQRLRAELSAPSEGREESRTIAKWWDGAWHRIRHRDRGLTATRARPRH